MGPVRIAGRFPLLAVILLILAPGLALGYFGLQALTEREQSLRTTYTATIVLVRDRLVAELTRLASAVSVPATPSALAALEAENTWLRRPFILQADGGILSSRLQAGILPHSPDAVVAVSATADAVAEAEHHEFVRGDLDSALRAYRHALTRLPQSAAAERAFLLTRTGRTLFKLKRFAEGVAEYQGVEAFAGDMVDRNGLPYASIALLQIIDGCTVLRRPGDVAAARQRLARYVLDHPWDLDNGYGQQLASVVGHIPPSDTVALAEAAALTRQAAEVAWARKHVAPRLMPELTGADSRSAEQRYAVFPGDRPALIGYRRVAHDEASPPAIFAYEVRMDYVSGPLLAHILKTVDLGDDLQVVLTAHEDSAGERPNMTSSAPLAQAGLLPSIPSWRVALFDKQGRSTPQLVARERWTYAALVTGMLAVMGVGVALTLIASTRAAELARARSDFVANVSHELKTPLALIRMFGETLESGIVDEPTRRQEFYGIIKRESERLTHLIDNVLDLSRIDQGTKQYLIRPDDLVQTVQTALGAYRPLFDRIGFTVETTFPRAPVPVSIDREAIIQSLVNLFQNVIKYSGTAHYVSVAVQQGEETASVSVADHGIGISADHVQRIFDRYYRVPQAAASVPVGSGLGLAIVKHTMDAHGGRVDVRSMPGEGTVVTLVLAAASRGAAVVSLPANPGSAGA